MAEHGADFLYKDTLRQTAMYYLARDGKFEAIKLFVNKGVPVEDSDNYGQTPLFYACREGHLEIASYLVENGADVNHKDCVG